LELKAEVAGLSALALVSRAGASLLVRAELSRSLFLAIAHHKLHHMNVQVLQVKGI
jgi:hypothetical protein